MDLNLNQKVALVTGSHRGTRKAIATALAREGARVILHGFEQDAVEVASAEIGVQDSVFGDITTDEGAEQVCQQALKVTGQVDLLINNYGTAGFGTWLTSDSNAWLDMFQKNTLSAVRMTRLLMPRMKELKWGRIIQIGTIGSHRPNKVMPHYYAAKGALANMTVSLARELSNTGITVNTVSPGLIRTDELEAHYREKAKRLGWGTSWEEIEASIAIHDFPNPVGRIARREEVADLVAFLCSDRADFINGQNIQIDGGALGIV
ncbi:MAG: SDR family oxidoreductase [Deltaproteobacteria bacterium]|jgi:3-oxoacyl-[acyl-carrier protein] reductase|nr:SDR family oxidoreductase [Deltaproteobacteria bacterium]MBT4639185.1 SDR family oxidoreductase [Deltaproteobacteria bacterium]MBT7713250.1 SDR family oxidoreductase [Deltaproteobacteria bacterium]